MNGEDSWDCVNVKDGRWLAQRVCVCVFEARLSVGVAAALAAIAWNQFL